MVSNDAKRHKRASRTNQGQENQLAATPAEARESIQSEDASVQSVLDESSSPDANNRAHYKTASPLVTTSQDSPVGASATHPGFFNKNSDISNVIQGADHPSVKRNDSVQDPRQGQQLVKQGELELTVQNSAQGSSHKGIPKTKQEPAVVDNGDCNEKSTDLPKLAPQSAETVHELEQDAREEQSS